MFLLAHNLKSKKSVKTQQERLVNKHLKYYQKQIEKSRSPKVKKSLVQKSQQNSINKPQQDIYPNHDQINQLQQVPVRKLGRKLVIPEIETTMFEESPEKIYRGDDHSSAIKSDQKIDAQSIIKKPDKKISPKINELISRIDSNRINPQKSNDQDFNINNQEISSTGHNLKENQFNNLNYDFSFLMDDNFKIKRKSKLTIPQDANTPEHKYFDDDTFSDLENPAFQNIQSLKNNHAHNIRIKQQNSKNNDSDDDVIIVGIKRPGQMRMDQAKKQVKYNSNSLRKEYYDRYQESPRKKNISQRKSYDYDQANSEKIYRYNRNQDIETDTLNLSLNNIKKNINYYSPTKEFDTDMKSYQGKSRIGGSQTNFNKFLPQAYHFLPNEFQNKRNQFQATLNDKQQINNNQIAREQKLFLNDISIKEKANFIQDNNLETKYFNRQTDIFHERNELYCNDFDMNENDKLFDENDQHYIQKDLPIQGINQSLDGSVQLAREYDIVKNGHDFFNKVNDFQLTRNNFTLTGNDIPPFPRSGYDIYPEENHLIPKERNFSPQVTHYPSRGLDFASRINDLSPKSNDFQSIVKGSPFMRNEFPQRQIYISQRGHDIRPIKNRFPLRGKDMFPRDASQTHDFIPIKEDQSENNFSFRENEFPPIENEIILAERDFIPNRSDHSPKPNDIIPKQKVFRESNFPSRGNESSLKRNDFSPIANDIPSNDNDLSLRDRDFVIRGYDHSPKDNDFSFKDNEIQPHGQVFTSRENNFITRVNDFTPQDNDFISRGNQFSPQVNDFPHRGNNIPMRGNHIPSESRYLHHRIGLPPKGKDFPPRGNDFPPRGNGFPPRGNGFQPRGNCFPSRRNGFPPRGNGFPPRGNEFPLVSNEFSPRGNEFPPRGNSFPPRGNSFPPRGYEFPPSGNGFPPRGNVYPPRGNEFPPRGNGFPPRGNDFTSNIYDLPYKESRDNENSKGNKDNSKGNNENSIINNDNNARGINDNSGGNNDNSRGTNFIPRFNDFQITSYDYNLGQNAHYNRGNNNFNQINQNEQLNYSSRNDFPQNVENTYQINPTKENIQQSYVGVQIGTSKGQLQYRNQIRESQQNNQFQIENQFEDDEDFNFDNEFKNDFQKKKALLCNTYEDKQHSDAPERLEKQKNKNIQSNQYGQLNLNSQKYQSDLNLGNFFQINQERQSLINPLRKQQNEIDLAQQEQINLQLQNQIDNDLSLSKGQGNALQDQNSNKSFKNELLKIDISQPNDEMIIKMNHRIEVLPQKARLGRLLQILTIVPSNVRVLLLLNTQRSLQYIKSQLELKQFNSFIYLDYYFNLKDIEDHDKPIIIYGTFKDAKYQLPGVNILINYDCPSSEQYKKNVALLQEDSPYKQVLTFVSNIQEQIQFNSLNDTFKRLDLDIPQYFQKLVSSVNAPGLNFILQHLNQLYIVEQIEAIFNDSFQQINDGPQFQLCPDSIDRRRWMPSQNSDNQSIQREQNQFYNDDKWREQNFQSQESYYKQQTENLKNSSSISGSYINQNDDNQKNNHFMDKIETDQQREIEAPQNKDS